MTDECRIEGDTAYSDRLTSIYGAGMERMGQSLIDGKLTLDEWHQQMKDAIDKMYVFQAMAGVNGDQSQVDQVSLTNQLKDQYGYLDGFASDIETAIKDGKSLDFVPSRAALYAGSSQESYWNATTGEADLPAYPGDGSSECLGNCGCKWVCRNGKWYWMRGKNDSCPTCLQRAEEWSPYEG